ncbi:MAG: hypothetical protein GWO02_16160, partial [Gammaproteobacteria bacterium]|nr:hypothetical protein [Gammaproteobacteria bacterium]
MYEATGEQFAAAARILGATERLRSRVGITPAPIEVALREHAVALCEEALSSSAAHEQMAEGGEMSL